MGLVSMNAQAADSRCPPSIPGAAEVVARTALTLIGEVHGTHEMPEAMLAVACSAAQHRPVRIGLGIPVAENERIERFLKDGDRAELLCGSFWHREFQDGRSSEAMLTLLDQIRRVRQLGVDVGVFLFDD